MGTVIELKHKLRQLKTDPARYMVMAPSVPITFDTANRVPRIDWWLGHQTKHTFRIHSIPYPFLSPNLPDVGHNGRLHQADAQSEQEAGHEDVRGRGGEVKQQPAGQMWQIDEYHRVAPANQIGQVSGEGGGNDLRNQGGASCYKV